MNDLRINMSLLQLCIIVTVVLSSKLVETGGCLADLQRQSPSFLANAYDQLSSAASPMIRLTILSLSSHKAVARFASCACAVSLPS